MLEGLGASESGGCELGFCCSLFEGGSKGLLELTVVIAVELWEYSRNRQTVLQMCKLDGVSASSIDPLRMLRGESAVNPL